MTRSRKAPAKTAAHDAAERPHRGGSYVRQPGGALKLTEGAPLPEPAPDADTPEATATDEAEG